MGQHGKVWREKGERRSDYDLKKTKQNKKPMVHTSISPRQRDGTLKAKKSFLHVPLGPTHSLTQTSHLIPR